MSCYLRDDDNISTDILNDIPVLLVTNSESDTINFGQIIQGEVIEIQFNIKNSGTGNLIINSAKTSCGCTKLKFPRKMIKENDEDIISVNFDSSGRIGKQVKNITLLTNCTPNTRILTIIGEVIPDNN
tara:strand:- start:4027 stop:4410 length:384 start_codon:yes stop_codon:yes gene_type:complete